MIGQLFSWFIVGRRGLHCLQGSANLSFCCVLAMLN